MTESLYGEVLTGKENPFLTEGESHPTISVFIVYTENVSSPRLTNKAILIKHIACIVTHKLNTEMLGALIVGPSSK